MHKQECPKCNADISDNYERADPSVGIMSSGWYCDYCEEFVVRDYEPTPRDSNETLGTPISELGTQPGTEGYEEFKRIASSWGYS